MDAPQIYSIPGFQEPVSCFTHLFAVPVFVVLGYFLIRRGRGNRWHAASLAVLVLCTVFLLSMSAVYHLLGPGAGRDVLRRLDIAGVFALIAGTVTPVHTILFKGFHRWAPLVLVWSVAVIGITLRSMFPHGLPTGFGTGIFLLMGWGGLISFVLLYKRYGFAFVEPLLWGGVAYSVGAIILGFDWVVLIPGVIRAHELWHIAVLVGLGLHWKFVFQFAAGPPGATDE